MKIRIQNAPAPAPGRSTFFVDPNMDPKQKLVGGASSDIGFNGAPITLNEGVAPSADAGGVWLYSKDISDIAELFCMDGAGNEIRITSGGLLSQGKGGGQFWPTQTGKVSFDVGLFPLLPSSQIPVPTGLIMAPAAGQTSIIHFRCITAQIRNQGTPQYSNGDASPGFFVGWVAFNSPPGTPDTRVSGRWAADISDSAPFIAIDTSIDKGCTVLSSGELVLNFSTPSYETWMNGSLVATFYQLPADL